MRTLIESLGGLDCPLVFLDTETTGLHPEVDRIVQIAAIKLYPEGRESVFTTYVNPEEPIPPEASRVHGITDEKVAGAPTFREIAGKLSLSLAKCDFAGSHTDFDLDMLRAEFVRVNPRLADCINGRILDTHKIFHAFHRRDLTAAVKLYLDENMEGAHDAMADARYSLRVLAAQLIAHAPDLPQGVGALHRKYFEDARGDRLDPEGKLIWRFNEACVSFGRKHVNVPLRELVKNDPGFLRWMLKSDFSWKVKQSVREALEHGKFPVREK